MTKNCLICKKVFEARDRNIIKGMGKYCSKKCAGIGRQKRVEFICLVCQRVFWVWKSRADRNNVKYCSNKCMYKDMKNRKGSLGRNWRGGIDQRRPFIQKTWVRDILQRDDFTCKMCRRRGIALQAHHILPYSKFPEFSLNKKNGVALCLRCHDMIRKREWLYAPKFLGI